MDKHERLIGQSQAMLTLYEQIHTVATTPVPVLIHGETGTGKELVARALHHASGRVGPLVAINCAAVVESLIESELFGHEKGAFTGACQRQTGRFEQAQGGTLLLDEISEATPAFQAKLLRVLDSGVFERVGGRQPVRSDTRIIAATNRNLKEWVSEGKFREDLYYRLSVVELAIPPLRERKEDIPLLVDYLLQRITMKIGREVPVLSETATMILMDYHWPGNVRELETVLTRAVLSSRHALIQTRDLECLTNNGNNGRCHPMAFQATLREVEHEHIIQVLKSTGWHQGNACEVLGISRPTLRKRLRNYGWMNMRLKAATFAQDGKKLCDGLALPA